MQTFALNYIRNRQKGKRFYDKSYQWNFDAYYLTPGKFGIGTFGQSAYDFVDFLVETKQTYWQILPLTTTSYGDSPYQSFSDCRKYTLDRL